MKTIYWRILTAVFFVFWILVIGDVIHIASNKISWGWLSYNVLAWIMVEAINLIVKHTKWKINLASLFAWFFWAIFLNAINGMFFYVQTFGKFDRFAHFFLLGILGTFVFFSILRQVLKIENVKLNIYLQSVLVFMAINTLSVLHEIAEYGLNIFQFTSVEAANLAPDQYDTADDIFLLAVGSLISILFVLAFQRKRKLRPQTNNGKIK